MTLITLILSSLPVPKRVAAVVKVIVTSGGTKSQKIVGNLWTELFWVYSRHIPYPQILVKGYIPYIFGDIP